MWNQGKLDEAMEMYQKALGIRIKALGPDHHTTIIAVGALAEVLLELGRVQEARDVFGDAVSRAHGVWPDPSHKRVQEIEALGKRLDEAE